VTETTAHWLATADPMTRQYWAAAAEHRLLVQRCAGCGHHQFYPRPFCLACSSRRIAWQQVTGRGWVYSLTTVRIPVHPDLPPPYVVALVDLDEGPRLLTNLAGECAIGDRVRVHWERRDDLVVPVFATDPAPTEEP
jgi:uncharacterized OB-fold protein